MAEPRTSSASMLSFEGRSLIECFNAGRTAFKQLDDAVVSGTDPRYATVVETGIEAFRQCLSLIDKLGLFSMNEEVEDIKTGSLKFVFLLQEFICNCARMISRPNFNFHPLGEAEFWLGEIYMKTNDMNRRLEAVRNAQRLLKNFVENCLTLQLIPKDEVKAWERTAKIDAATQRAEKIARSKRKKEAETALHAILQQKGTTTDGEEFEEGGDEEFERELSLRLIAVAVNQALDTIEMTKQELEILEMMAQRRAQGLPMPKREQPDPNVPREIKYFTVDRKLKIKERMFRPHWIQPTVTVEEAGLADLRDAERRSAQSKAKEEEDKKRKEEKHEYDSDDEEVAKKRNWDDWKDGNSRGSGNRGNLGYTY